MVTKTLAPSTVETAYSARTDLQQFGSNARLLFALQLRFQLEDVQTVAANCLTDSPDDCKCDLIYVDQDAGVAVIAQGYECKDSTKKSASANKAATLGTAVSWLLSRQLKDLPKNLQAAAKELRDALKGAAIKSVQLWYVHNLSEARMWGKSSRRLNTLRKLYWKSTTPVPISRRLLV